MNKDVLDSQPPLAESFPAPFDQAPAIVGTVSTLAALRAFPNREDKPCDILEARLDAILKDAGMSADDEGWLTACAAVEAAGTRVLLTLRLAVEGGFWEGLDSSRLQPLLQSVDELSAIDVEFRSDLLPLLVERAAAQGKAVVVSHHDFERTPDAEALGDQARRMAIAPNVVVKIATRATEEADIERLRGLLALEMPHGNPLCVIGMGDDWSETRVSFPREGSALTYAYLDTSAAPGQLSCVEVRRRLREGAES